MFDDLKKMFSQSWEAFLSELGKREPEDQVAELLGSMRREMVEVRASLPLLEQNHRAALAAVEREKKAMEDTLRRAAMAERIGDAETVRVAREYAEKQRRRIAVLEDKARAAKSEWDLREDESREMMARYKEADANRFGLLAEMRRQGTRGRIDAAMGGTRADDFARAEESIESDSAYADALDGLDDSPRPRRASLDEDDIEARLAEIKRRMGQ